MHARQTFLKTLLGKFLLKVLEFVIVFAVAMIVGFCQLGDERGTGLGDVGWKSLGV